MGERIMGMFTYMLAGYLSGLIIGFTVFDPDLDVWALLGAVLGIAGLLVGLLPIFRHHVHVVLMALLGFYVGMLLGTLLFGGGQADGLLDALQNDSIVITMLICTAAGIITSVRMNVARFRVPLFAFVMGGFLMPAILIIAFQIEESDIALAPMVIVSGLFWGGLVLGVERRTSGRLVNQ